MGSWWGVLAGRAAQRAGSVDEMDGFLCMQALPLQGESQEEGGERACPCSCVFTRCPAGGGINDEVPFVLSLSVRLFWLHKVPHEAPGAVHTGSSDVAGGTPLSFPESR